MRLCGYSVRIKGATAFTVVESDEQIPEEILAEIQKNEHVQDLMLVQM